MTKVEELRKEILKMVDFMSPYDMEMMRKRLTRLVAAADAQGFARGVAEGEEKTLAKIREVARPLLVSRGGALEVVSIPASVLAPKEKK